MMIIRTHSIAWQYNSWWALFSGTAIGSDKVKHPRIHRDVYECSRVVHPDENYQWFMLDEMNIFFGLLMCHWIQLGLLNNMVNCS
jgi:hypothetical protein